MPKGVQKQNISIRNKKSLEDTYISIDLHEYLLAKDTNSFLKLGKKKFKAKQKPPLSVDGHSDPRDISKAFATHFKDACSPNNAKTSVKLYKQFHSRFSQYKPASQYKVISVELFDQYIHKMNEGKLLVWIALRQNI